MANPLPAATWVRPPRGARLHRARRILQAVTSLIFLLAPFIDLLRFDLRRGRLVLFFTSFALREMYVVYLVILLFILAVFAGALIWGRIYCGWMCPQTTLSEIVSSIERRVCKGRKGSPVCRVAGPLAALAMSAFVAASLVTYFLDPADYLHPPRLAWISWLITAGVLFGDLTLLRHRFCLGVCPYGILQNLVQDQRTLGVELDPARAAECTNCLLCVRACFMGVDIRKQSFSTACLNCGDCISATTLSKTCPDQPLIRFRYGTLASTWPGWLRKLGIVEPRRAIVMLLVVVVTAVTVGFAAARKDLDADVAALYEKAVQTADGNVQNTYRVTINNRLEHPVRIRLELTGVPGLTIVSPEGGLDEVAAGDQRLMDLVVTAPTAGLETGVHPAVLRGQVEGTDKTIELQTFLFVPSRR